MARPLRIYLDTAILLDRADGKWSPELVERFDDAVIQSAANVVITASHFWDIHASASAAGRERAIAAIEKMPNLRGVVVSPPQIEEPRIDAAMSGQSVEEVAPDITLGEVPDLSEVVAETAPGFFALAGAGASMAEGGNISRRASDPEREEAVVAEFFRRLVSGESVTDFLKTLNMNDESLRAAMAQLATLEPMAELWRPVVQKELERVGGDPRTLVSVLRKTKGSPADVGWSSTEKGENRWYEGIEIAERLEVLDVIKDNYRLVAPQTLLLALAQEAHDAENHANSGKGAFVGGDDGLHVRQIEPGHPALVEEARKAKARLAWCRTHMRVVPRPLRFLAPKPAPGTEMRDQIGIDSWDAVEVALDQCVPLWTDDIGLRRVDIGNQRADGLSTLAVLVALGKKGAIESCYFNRCLHTLVIQRYGVIRPTRDLLLSAISRHSDLGVAGVTTVLQTMTLLPNVAAAADLFADVLRAVAVTTVQSLSIQVLTLSGLGVLAARWSAAVVARQLHYAAARTLALLPLSLREVQQVCNDFGRRLPTAT